MSSSSASLSTENSQTFYRLRLVSDVKRTYWVINGENFPPFGPLLEELLSIDNFIPPLETEPRWSNGEEVDVKLCWKENDEPIARVHLQFSGANWEVSFENGSLSARTYSAERSLPGNVDGTGTGCSYRQTFTGVTKEDVKREGWLVVNRYGAEHPNWGVENGVLWTNDRGLMDVVLVPPYSSPENLKMIFDISSGYSSDMPEWLIVFFGCRSRPLNLYSIVEEAFHGDGVWAILFEGEYNPERITRVHLITATPAGISFQSTYTLPEPLIVERRPWSPPYYADPQVSVRIGIEVTDTAVRTLLQGKPTASCSKLISTAGYVAACRGWDYLTYWDNFAFGVLDITPPTSTIGPVPSLQLSELRNPPWDLRLKSPITITATATDDLSGVGKVQLWYRYSLDNWTDTVAWKKRSWTLYGTDEDPSDGWSWAFDAPEGYGYYEFYTIAIDKAGNIESVPSKAYASCRVAKNLVKVVVICAEPRNIEHMLSRDELKDIRKNTISYFDEASYGALALDIKIFDNAGNWFKCPRLDFQYLTKTLDTYVTYNEEFLTDAIKAADGQINYQEFTDGDYVILVVGAGAPPRIGYTAVTQHWFIWYWESWHEVQTDEGVVNRIALVSEWNEGTWAHEIAHVLGKIFSGRVLPDLYKTSYVLEGGDINDWGLMGSPRYWPVHPCSWTKERLGWLKYQDISSYSGYIKSLPNLSYNDTILRRWTDGSTYDEYFVFEVRSRDRRHSEWDYSLPIAWEHVGGLVLYKWYDPLIGAPTLNSVPNPKTGRGYFLPGESYWLKPPFTAWYWFDEPGVLPTVLEQRVTEDKYEIKVDVRESWCWENRITARLVPASRWWYNVRSSIPTDNLIWPDLDLHAYTLDGRHVGVNYTTGEYEIQIPGAIVSGEFFNSSEWISVPDNVEVFFIVSSHDVASFLKSRPAGLDNENGLYTLTSWYFDENMKGSGSDARNQVIPPGAEVFHRVEIKRLPDGKYSVEVKPGMNLLSLEAWHAAIDNIPNSLFINNPAQRKNALKNKLRAVFNQVAENNYLEAIDKVTNDVFEKLDADGKADWTMQPALVEELKAFLAILTYRLNQNT
jgi:M6 family metalloprotease-like protein